MFLKLLTSLDFLLRQGLPIRGHNEQEGNLLQLLECRALDVKGLREWIGTNRYLSHDIINEIIEIMANQVLRDILSNIKDSEFYAVIADETQDVSTCEQFAISIRWVDSCHSIHEDLIGMEQTDALTMSSTIKDVLIRCGLSLSNCRGQAYDGSSNMSGHLSGVATRLLAEEPCALYVHCSAHCLNLALQDSSRRSTCVRDALSLAADIANFIRASPKRFAQFRSLKDQLCKANPGIKPLCPTRWTVRTASIDTILKNYGVIIQQLEEIEASAHGDASSKAAGLIAHMEKFSTFFGLKLAHLVFSATEQTSITLQYKDINAQEALMAVKTAQSYMTRHRSETAFDTFYRSVVHEATEYTGEPILPRVRKLPRRFDDSDLPVQYSCPEEYFRRQYYEILDIVNQEMTNRFDQATFRVLQEIENINILIRSCNGDTVTLSDGFKNLYSKDLKLQNLSTQLSLLPDIVSTVNTEHQMGVKKVTTVNTVVELLNCCSFSRTMLKEVNRLLRLYLTIPLTSVTAERSFSSLRRLKSYLKVYNDSKKTKQYYYYECIQEQYTRYTKSCSRVCLEK